MTRVVRDAPAPAVRPSPWDVGSRDAPRRRRLLLGAGGAFVAVSAVFGFPTGREVVTAWLLLLLYAIVAGDGPAWRRAVLRDWLPLIAVLFAYDTLRGFADGLVERAHVLPQLRADEWLFGGTVPTVRLQQWLYDCVPSWYDIVDVPVYMSHFVVPTAVAAGLWARSYDRFRRFTWSLVALTAMTLVTYAAFPAVPPWLASETPVPGGTGQTYLPYVERVTPHTLEVAGIPTIKNAVQRGEVYANPVAAIPSLHSAVPMLVVLLAWPRCRRRGRALLVLYLGWMTFALVYGGEHYVVDVLIGWAYAAVAVALVTRLLRDRGAGPRREESGAEGSPVEGSPVEGSRVEVSRVEAPGVEGRGVAGPGVAGPGPEQQVSPALR